MSTSKSETKSDDENTPIQLQDVVDMTTFEQILEMDDGNDHEFSYSIVYGFFDQAESTFVEMDEALEKSDLSALSSLGHFLKGSSATLGLRRVRDGCEKIQRYGLKEELDGSDLPDEQLCLDRIKEAIEGVKVDITEAHQAFDTYYEQQGESEEER